MSDTWDIGPMRTCPIKNEFNLELAALDLDGRRSARCRRRRRRPGRLLLLLKCCDLATDGRARFTPHTAFVDPTTPADAEPRESIKLRTMVFHRQINMARLLASSPRLCRRRPGAPHGDASATTPWCKAKGDPIFDAYQPEG
jgi:hypothetical protein